MAIVGIIELKIEQLGAMKFVGTTAAGESLQLKDLPDGTCDIFAFFKGAAANDTQVRAGLSEDQMILFRQRSSQRVAVDGAGDLYQAYVGRVRSQGGAAIDVHIEGPIDRIGYALVESR